MEKHRPFPYEVQEEVGKLRIQEQFDTTQIITPLVIREVPAGQASVVLKEMNCVELISSSGRGPKTNIYVRTSLPGTGVCKDCYFARSGSVSCILLHPEILKVGDF